MTLPTVETILVATKEQIKNKADWFGGDNPQTTPRHDGKHQTCAYVASTQALSHYDAFALSNAVDEAMFNALPKHAKRGNFHTRGGCIVAYNDTHTHKAVLRWLNKAIRLAANNV